MTPEREIRPLGLSDAPACDAIIATLPYHFALEEGRLECARAVRTQPGLVATYGEEVEGFLTWEPRFEEAAEITWMAVRADRRRAGIGRVLIDHLGAMVKGAGRSLLLVLTVSPSDPVGEPPDGYQVTRAFYRSAGFVLARDLPREWDGDTAVLMVKVLR